MSNQGLIVGINAISAKYFQIISTLSCNIFKKIYIFAFGKYLQTQGSCGMNEKNKLNILKMKKVQDASVGGRNFYFDVDAYERMEQYLKHFEERLQKSPSSLLYEKDEVMSDLEDRIAELLAKEIGTGNRTVNIDLVQKITEQLGMPDGVKEPEDTAGDGGSEGGQQAGAGASGSDDKADNTTPPKKKMYRDIDEKAIGGVCSGLAAYFDIDVVLVRLIAVAALIMGTAGFWIYIILMIVIPKAETPVQKCEMYGLPMTAENLARFSTKK